MHCLVKQRTLYCVPIIGYPTRDISTGCRFLNRYTHTRILLDNCIFEILCGMCNPNELDQSQSLISYLLRAF